MHAWTNTVQIRAGPGLTFLFVVFFFHFFCTSWWKFKNILTQYDAVFITDTQNTCFSNEKWLGLRVPRKGKRYVLVLEQSASTKQNPKRLEEAVRNKAFKTSCSYSTGVFYSKECIKIHLRSWDWAMDLDSYGNVLFKPTWSLQWDKRFWKEKLK